MNAYTIPIIIFCSFFLILAMPLSSAAHFIVGQVNDSLDGVSSANGRSVVLWNPANGIADNVTDIVGPSGNSGENNLYLIDCELLNTPCAVGDEIRSRVFDDGGGYFTPQTNLTVTGAGFDVMPGTGLNSPPNATLISPANASTVASTDLVDFSCNVSDLDGNLANATLYGNWSGGWHANQTISLSGTNATASFNASLPDGNYEWSCEVIDDLGISRFAEQNFTFTRNFLPLISFTAGTESNGTQAEQTSIFANVSVIEDNFANITYTLANDTDVINVTTYVTLVTSLNWTGLSDNFINYTYNVTVFDTLGGNNSTETREIQLTPDIFPPEIEIQSPAPEGFNYTTSSVLFNVTLNEQGNVCSYSLDNGVTNNSMSTEDLFAYNATNTSMLDGQYTVIFYCNDTSGNLGTNTTYFGVDTSTPLISYTFGTPSDGETTSSTSLFVNVSVTELHPANTTYTLFNTTDLVNETTYDGLISFINWTGLTEGIYSYNVTIVDIVSNSNSTETRSLTIDSTLPSGALLSPANNSTLTNPSQNFSVNASDTLALANATLFVYNISNNLINQTTRTLQGTNNLSSVIYTLPYDGNFTWSYEIVDSANNRFFTENFSLSLDSTPPLISYTTGTESNGTSFERNWIFVNVSVTGQDFLNITYELYNDTDGLTLVNRTEFNLTSNVSDIYSINWTDLNSANVTYFYNVTAYDFLDNANTTETRTITLIDTTSPGLVLLNPPNATLTNNESISLIYNVIELNPDTCWYNLNEGPNITLSNCDDSSFSVADEASYTLRLYVNDSFGLINQTQESFFVNTSAVFTNYWRVERGSVTINGQQTVTNLPRYDLSKSFVLHTVVSATSSPNALQTTGQMLNSTSLVFENFAGANADVEWELITGPNLSVQSGSITYDTTNGTFNVTLSETVNLSESFVIVSNRLNSGTNSQNVQGLWTARLVNETDVEFERGVTGTAGTLSWQVVEWEGARVQSGSFSSTALSGTDSLSTPVTLNQSFLIFSRHMTGTATGLNDINVGGYFINETDLGFYRQDTGTTMFTEWFVIDSHLLITEQNSRTVSGSTGPHFEPLARNLINQSRSFNRASWDSSGNGNSHANAVITSNLTNHTTVEFRKGTGNQNQNVSWQSMEIIEIGLPVVDLLHPVDLANFSSHTIDQFNYSVNDTSELSSCSLYGNWTTTFHSNQTVSSPPTATENNFSSVDVLSDGRYIWNVECTDVYGNVGTNATNFTFTSDTTIPSVSSVLINSTNTCGAVQVNCTVTDALTGIDQVFIQAEAPSGALNYTATNITADTYAANIALNESGVWTFTCHADDFVDNLAATPATENTTVDAVDLTLNSTDIIFETLEPAEGQSISINATVHNQGCFEANGTVIGFFDGDPGAGGIQINGNQSGNILPLSNITVNVTWPASIGPTNVFTLLDLSGIISEGNETNNQANATINVTAWQEFYGNVTVDRVISNINISNLTVWFNESSSSGNVFVTDTESDISWTSLVSLGHDSGGSNTSNDFIEVDTLLNMTSFEDSIANTFTTNGTELRNQSDFFVHGNTITEVPIVRSVNVSNFVTGILWDSSDDVGDGEYSQDDREDLVFLANINRSMPGAYGLYDYEIRIPVQLREYDDADTQSVYFYFDLN